MGNMEKPTRALLVESDPAKILLLRKFLADRYRNPESMSVFLRKRTTPETFVGYDVVMLTHCSERTATCDCSCQCYKDKPRRAFGDAAFVVYSDHPKYSSLLMDALQAHRDLIVESQPYTKWGPSIQSYTGELPHVVVLD